VGGGAGSCWKGAACRDVEVVVSEWVLEVEFEALDPFCFGFPVLEKLKLKRKLI